MKKITLIAAAVLVLAAGSFAQTWSVDKAHSNVGFSINHLSVSDITGNFKTFDAKITATQPDFSDAAFEFTADVNSINTNNEQRDAHLKTPDFFDAAQYGTISFKSTSVTKTGAKTFKVTGDLTFHGVTKSVTLVAVLNGTTVNPQSKKPLAGFKVTGTIKRTDFGIAAKFPAAMLGDDVALVANGEFSKD